MSPDWIAFRKLADDYLIKRRPGQHELPEMLDKFARAWANDLGDLADCKKQLRQALSRINEVEQLM
jgi:hypothetical protein